jgi:hypothetical protein
MQRWLVLMGAVLFLSMALPLMAQTNEEGAGKVERAQEVVSERFGVRIPRPSGWLIGEPPHGALAVFRSATDPMSQIEVRVSTNVAEHQLGAFYRSFHNTLRRSGFALREERQDVRYGERAGLETEYEVRSEGQEFRLFVYQFHRHDQAWIVTGFFPAPRAESYKRAYEQVIGEMAFR